MTNKEAIKWLNKNRPCISMTCNKENADNINIATDMAIEALENKRPQGEWIIDGHHYKCSRCGKTLAIMFSETDDDDLIGCPFCLADMRGGRE